MPAKNEFEWIGSFDRGLLMRTIKECRKIDNGRVSFGASDYAFWLPVLVSAIRVTPVVGSLKSRCIEKALNDLELNLDNDRDFLDRCNEQFKKLTEGKKREFILLCSITYEGERLFNRLIDDRGVSIWQPDLGNGLYKAALKSRATLDDLATSLDVTKTDLPLTPIFVKVEALDARHAFEISIGAVDKLRGILNLIVNSNRSINPFGRFNRRAHAINRFRLGPVHTLHEADGSLAAKTIWYEARWWHLGASVKFKGDKKKIRGNIARYWKILSSSPLRDYIGTGLLRYCRALDRHDDDVALIGLWSTLEFLTGASSYDQVVSRITKLFKDDHFARQIAQHIRQRRNETVHSASSPDQSEADAVLLHADTLVARMLSFLIRDNIRFKDADELFEFLDMPLNLRELSARKKMIDKFVRYRNRS